MHRRTYCVASGGGREQISMDRDRRWEKIALGWQIHVAGVGGLRVREASQAVFAARRERPALCDQDLPPFVVVDSHGEAVGPMRDDDVLLHLNFRADRALQWAQAMEEADFAAFVREPRPRLHFAGMTCYDEDADLPRQRLMAPTRVGDGLGDRLMALGKRQFRLAETQKYAHVTFFFNGGRKTGARCSS